jgi:hypothetical protein
MSLYRALDLGDIIPLLFEPRLFSRVLWTQPTAISNHYPAEFISHLIGSHSR